MMETVFFVIILFLVILKLLIWVCVFSSRARRQQADGRTGRGIIIIQEDVLPRYAGDRDTIINRDHTAAVSVIGIDNAGMNNLPTYEEVQRTKNMEEKPPSYEQVMDGPYSQVNGAPVYTPQSPSSTNECQTTTTSES